jgi:hypothetical protein
MRLVSFSSTLRCAAAGLLLVCASATNASASAFTYSFSNTVQSARLDAQVSGSNLIITLTNTSIEDPSTPTEILTGVFFDIAGDPTLNALSAAICQGCSVTGGGLTDANGGVGGEWAYKSATDLAFGANYGISSTGLSLFGPKDIFGGTSFSKNPPNGLGYGITTTNDKSANNNGGMGVPLIMNSVVFTFSGVPQGFDPSTAITNVTFQYGTALNELTVAEPATLPLLVVGIVFLATYRQKRTA